MTLSATETADIRDTTGASTTTEFSDAKIQAQYDVAVTDATAAGDTSLIFPYTYVYVLRKLWGIRSIETDRTTDHGDHILRSQIRDATKLLLDYWEMQTGLTGGLGGEIQTSELILNLNFAEEDITTNG